MVITGRILAAHGLGAVVGNAAAYMPGGLGGARMVRSLHHLDNGQHSSDSAN